MDYLIKHVDTLKIEYFKKLETTFIKQRYKDLILKLPPLNDGNEIRLYEDFEYHIGHFNYYGEIGEDGFTMHGRGVLINSKNDVIYEGYWQKNRLNIYGWEIHPDGTVYEGNFKDDVRTGKGRVGFPNLDEYKGDFRNGQFDGYGVHTWNTGEIYRGYWKNGVKEGKGVYEWADGRKYEGEYVNDEKEGYGKYWALDGTFYKGFWKSGVKFGIGELTYKDGWIDYGMWEGDRLVEVKVKKEDFYWGLGIGDWGLGIGPNPQ